MISSHTEKLAAARTVKQAGIGQMLISGGRRVGNMLLGGARRVAKGTAAGGGRLESAVTAPWRGLAHGNHALEKKLFSGLRNRMGESRYAGYDYMLAHPFSKPLSFIPKATLGLGTGMFGAQKLLGKMAPPQAANPPAQPAAPLPPMRVDNPQLVPYTTPAQPAGPQLVSSQNPRPLGT